MGIGFQARLSNSGLLKMTDVYPRAPLAAPRQEGRGAEFLPSGNRFRCRICTRKERAA